MQAQTVASAPAALKFTTLDSGLAQWLVHRDYRAKCALDPAHEGNVIFWFADTQQLREDVAAYLAGATAPAIAMNESGRVIRRLILGARYRHQEYQRRTAAGINTSRMQDVRRLDEITDAITHGFTGQ